MISIRFKSIFLIILYFCFIYSADWENLTSQLDITDIFIDDNRIYAATMGGLIVIDKTDGIMTVLDYKNDINPLDLSSVYVDSRQNILLGSNGPQIGIQMLNYNYESLGIVSLDGIENISQIKKIIEFNNNIYAVGKGNEVDILIEFRFDENNNLYYQTVVNNLPVQNISTIYDIDLYDSENINNHQLFLTTNKGIIRGSVLENEIIWSVENENDLEQSFFINGSIFSNQFKGEEIVDIYGFLDEFNIMTSRTLYNVLGTDTVTIFESPYEFVDFTHIHRNEDLIAVAIGSMGLYTIENNSIYNMYIPGTIFQNKFTAITVTDDSKIVAVGENGGVIISDDKITNFIPYNKKKYYPVNDYMDDQELTELLSFNQANFFNGLSRNYRSGMQSPLSVIESNWNSIYFTNPGIAPDSDNPANSPLVEINLDSYICSNYGIGDDVIDGMNGIVDITSENSNYMVINHLDKDRHGNLWVLNPYAENNNNIIAIQTADNSWHHIKDPYGLDPMTENNSLLPTSFDFGPDGRIWFSFRKYSNQDGNIVSSGGIKILDYNNTINYLDDEWLELDNPEIFPGGVDIDIWSLAFSKNLDENILWILTGSGVKGYIINNLQLIEYPQTFYENIFFDQFDKLKVDSQNNVWIITQHSGVRIISQDTSPWPDAEGISTKNSPILSDIVYDVAFNENNGKIYFSTEKGISILESPFTKNPNEDIDLEILLSPNPFRIFNDNLLSIWNLFPGSKVRIMTLEGLVLKSFQLNENENKIDNWNGLMDNGNYISSGIYLVTASHKNYSSRIGKLAVIK